jgi:hypothetical protein
MSEATESKQYLCAVSGKPIPQMRVEYLQESGIPEENWTLVQHSTVTRKKGIYVGEVSGDEGLEEAGELVIVDRVDNTSVRSILAEPDSEEDDAV